MFVSGDGNGIVLTAYSKSGNCWILADNTSGVTRQSGQRDNVHECHHGRVCADRSGHAVREDPGYHCSALHCRRAVGTRGGFLLDHRLPELT